MSNSEMAGQPESIRYRQRITVILLLFAVVVFGVLGLSGCSQTESVSTEDTPQEVQAHTELPAEPISDPESVPEPEVVSLPQPQADGTGICFALPDDWSKYPADAMQGLQAIVDDAGNRVLYGVLHGFMESPEITQVSLADSADGGVEENDYVTLFDWSYNLELSDGDSLRLEFYAIGWGEFGSGEMEFDDVQSAEVYPAFSNYHWSLDCESPDGWGDWVYQIEDGSIIRYYSISERTLNEYAPYDETDTQPELDYSAMGWPGGADQTWEEYYYDGGQFYHDEYGQYFCKVYGTTLYWDASVNNWYYQSKDKHNCYRWNGTNYYVAGLDFSWAYDVNETGIWYWIDSSGVSKTNPPSEYTDYVQSEIERFTNDDFENSIEEWTETYGYTVYQDDNGQWTCEAPYGYWKYYPDEGRYGRWKGVIDIYNLWTGEVENAGVNVRVSVIKGYKISFYDEKGSEEIAKVSASLPDGYPNTLL